MRMQYRGRGFAVQGWLENSGRAWSIGDLPVGPPHVLHIAHPKRSNDTLSFLSHEFRNDLFTAGLAGRYCKTF